MIEHRSYANLTTYIFKAEAALEATTASNGPLGNSGSAPPTQSAAAAAKKRDKEQLQSRLDLATAFSHLGLGNYEKVASYIFRLGPPKDLGDWTGKVSRVGDCAAYDADLFAVSLSHLRMSQSTALCVRLLGCPGVCSRSS